MALVFQESFDVYGSGTTSRTNMLASSNMWVNLTSYISCTTTVSRTGTHSLVYTNGSSGDGGARFSLGGIRTSASGYHGFAWAWRPSNLPASGEHPLLYAYNSAGDSQYIVRLTASGTLTINTSAGTTLATSTAGLVSAGVFTHFEVKQKVPTTYNATDGEIYVKVNGTQVLAVTGVDICGTNSTAAANLETVGLIPTNALSAFGINYTDDLIVWDSTGGYCNDWIGNKACYVYYCDADTATADWTITGTTYGYDAINDTAPDADSTYLAATANGNISIFELPAVTPTLTGIKAVSVQSAIRQDSSGSSEMRVSLGGTTYTDGTSRVAPFPGATSTTYSYSQDHFYQDPDGAGNFTPAIISALKLKLTRTV
jgi:hypothetical protein